MSEAPWSNRSKAGHGRGFEQLVEAFARLSTPPIGEIMTSIAAGRGATGLVLDGAIRKSGAITRHGFPVLDRAAVRRGPYEDSPCATNAPVSIGGMLVNPGDLVVGDEDGLIPFPVDQFGQRA